MSFHFNYSDYSFTLISFSVQNISPILLRVTIFSVFVNLVFPLQLEQIHLVNIYVFHAYLQDFLLFFSLFPFLFVFPYIKDHPFLKISFFSIYFIISQKIRLLHSLHLSFFLDHPFYLDKANNRFRYIFSQL